MSMCKSAWTLRGILLRFLAAARDFFLLPEHPERLCSPPTVLFKGYQGVIPPGVKRPGREPDYPFLLMMNLKKKAGMPALLRLFSQLWY